MQTAKVKQVWCSACGRALAAEANLACQKQLAAQTGPVNATCGACDTTFVVEAFRPKRASVPRTVRVREEGGEVDADTGSPYRGRARAERRLVVERRWDTSRWVALAPFLVAYATLLAVGVRAVLGADVPPLIYGVLALGAAPFGYFFLSIFVNRTTITLSEGSLAIRRGPLPWYGNRELHLGDIESLARQETRAGAVPTLVARMRDGSAVPLLGGSPLPEEVTYLERVLGRRLQAEQRGTGVRVAASCPLEEELSEELDNEAADARRHSG